MPDTDVADCEVEILEVLPLAEHRKGWVVSRPAGSTTGRGSIC